MSEVGIDFTVVHPSGVAFRTRPHFEDRDTERTGPICNDVVRGVPVMGEDGVEFVATGDGFVPMHTPQGLPILVPCSELRESGENVKSRDRSISRSTHSSSVSGRPWSSSWSTRNADDLEAAEEKERRATLCGHEFSQHLVGLLQARAVALGKGLAAQRDAGEDVATESKLRCSNIQSLPPRQREDIECAAASTSVLEVPC